MIMEIDNISIGLSKTIITIFLQLK
jgi:hypothetical protein